MKKLFTIAFLLIFVGVIWMFKDDIYSYFLGVISGSNANIVMTDMNEYYRDYDFLYVKNTNNFKIKNRQELLDVYYTIINSGKDEFSFFCTREYTECLSDVDSLAEDQATLSDINNYVHPFNSFSNIETEYNSLGRVTVYVKKTYSDEEIQEINGMMDSLEAKLVKKDDSVYDNLLRIHDYIINDTKYDSNRSDNGDTTYRSDTAYGPLFQGHAICGGYTDLMQLFLERMNIKNFRVSSDEHIWNAIYYNNSWVNLDLTWDDPVSDDGLDYLEYDYFLINTSKLLDIEKEEHNFNFEHYPELKEA